MSSNDTLVAVDDALARGRPDAANPELRELQEIALAVRADAPAPDAAFVSGLDERVARRFERPARRRRRFVPPRAILAVVAGVVALVAVIGAVSGALRDGGRTPPIQPVAKEPVPAQELKATRPLHPMSAASVA